MIKRNQLQQNHFEVTSKVQPAENGVAFELKSANPNGIKYTTDGSEPNVNSISYENQFWLLKTKP